MTADDGVLRARAAWDAEDWPRAAELYEQLVAQRPDDPLSYIWFYDCALAYKFLRNWDKAFTLGREAAARAPRGVSDPAFWNLGIAATVRRDWSTARDAWAGYGIALPPGEGPIVEDLGWACVRLDTAAALSDAASSASGGGSAEVVWVRRLCPTRARVVSVPFVLSRRFGEVVLHDGEPKERRVLDGREFPVFDELMLFESSDLPTLSATVVVADPTDLDALDALLGERGLGFEALAGGVVMCRHCSEGTAEARRSPLSGSQDVLIAAPPDVAESILDDWRAAAPDARAWRNLHEADG